MDSPLVAQPVYEDVNIFVFPGPSCASFLLGQTRLVAAKNRPSGSPTALKNRREEHRTTRPSPRPRRFFRRLVPDKSPEVAEAKQSGSSPFSPRVLAECRPRWRRRRPAWRRLEGQTRRSTRARQCSLPSTPSSPLLRPRKTQGEGQRLLQAHNWRDVRNCLQHV